MQAIILAGGLNTRLKTVGVQPGQKPLLEITDEPLLATHIRTVRSLDDIDRIVVVCSPANVLRIVEDYGSHDTRFVVQPEAVGPGDALLRGLECADAKHALIICADNIISRPDILEVMKYFWPISANGIAFAAQSISDPCAAARFARFSHGRFFDGEVRERPGGSGGEYVVWLGPLIASRDYLKRALEFTADMYEVLGIVPALDDLASRRGTAVCPVFRSGIVDIGTPEALAAARAEYEVTS